MVQAIENWADVTGKVSSIGDSDKGPDWMTVGVQVEAVEDVEGFPNLVKGAAGDNLLIIARRSTVHRVGASEGSRIRCRVRKASPVDVFAHNEGLTTLSG